MHVSFQTALLHVRDVRLFLCRWHLRERNSTPTQRCCHPEYRWRMCPCAPEVHAYIDGSICTAVCLFHLVQFLQACHCSRVFWSAIISGVSVSLCHQTEAGFSTINLFLVSGRVLLSRFRGLPSSPCREHEDSINAQRENALRLQSQPPRLNIFNL